MKKLIYFLVITIILSCNNERVLQLPEIENAKITEVLDVSPAYIFYDKTQPDSTLFNRKNLIGTTNWLVNVDKRLTLKQAIPHIQYLQNKRKKESIHKNENAKNYFTCNDTSIKNLGFIEFTDVNYIASKKNIDIKTSLKIKDKSYYNNFIKDSTSLFKSLSGIHYINLDLKFGFKKNTYIISQRASILNAEAKKPLFFEYLKYLIENPTMGNTTKIKLHFSNSLSFQEYIWIKFNLEKIDSKMYIIETEEFIY